MCCTYTFAGQCANCKKTYKLYIMVKCATLPEGCAKDGTFKENINQGYEEFYPFQQLGLYHNCPRCAYEQSGLMHPQTGQPLTWSQFLLKGFVSAFDINGVTNYSRRTFTEKEFATAETNEPARGSSSTADATEPELRPSDAVDATSPSSGTEASTSEEGVAESHCSAEDGRTDWQASGLSHDY